MNALSDEFERFVRPHVSHLRALAHQYADSGEDAGDLVQETLLRAYRGFSPTSDAAYRRAWLVVIMRNIAAEWGRAARRRIRLVSVDHAELTELAAFDPPEELAPLPTMDEGRFREFLDERLAKALDGLEAPYREVIVLSVAGELSYREIGEVLGCPLGTVMSRMGRARRMLRERLADTARRAGWVQERRT